MNRIDRLLGYLLVFQSHNLVRAQDLAARFEVSERTVYRDIEALYEVGVPLVGMPGEGYQLLPGYYLPPIMFTEAEARALFLAVAMLTGLTTAGTTSQAATVALEKIRAVVPKATLAQVEALQTILGFYTISRPPLDLDNPTFLQLQQAIRQHKVVQLRYHALHDNQVTEREIEPLRLAYLDNTWVVTAWCRLRQDQRSFRLDRIDHLRVTTQTFTPRAVAEQRLPQEGQAVQVRFDGALVRWVREAQHFTFTHAEPATPDGTVIMHYRVHSFGQITGWLLRWGAEAEVLAPLDLRKEMLQTAIRIAERHRL
ncbi:MAG: YafY family protein [Caldilineaceae bacterium]